MTLKKELPILTVAEFKTWLETVEEFHCSEGEDWHPTVIQWEKIRSKIDQLATENITEKVDQLILEVQELKKVRTVSPINNSGTVVNHMQPQTTSSIESTLDVQLVDSLQPLAPTSYKPSGKAAPEVTLPPSVQLGNPSPDGRPAIRIDAAYDETGNYVSTFR